MQSTKQINTKLQSPVPTRKLRTSLYDLVSAIVDVSSLDDDYSVASIVDRILRSRRAKFIHNFHSLEV